MKQRISKATRWLFQQSQWYSSPIDRFPTQFQWTPKVWYPIYYILAIQLGVCAALIGSPILNRNFPPTLVDISGVGLAFMGLVGLAGIAFPKLAKLELMSLMTITFMLGCFAAVVVAIKPVESDVQVNLYTFTVILMAIFPTLSRITILLANPEVWHPKKVP